MLHSWSIALLICSAVVLYVFGMTSITAVKVLIFWDSSSDSERQIELEGKTWLSAALVQYGLVIQLISLVMLVMAAEEFSGMIAGAMCATGSFLANEYGSKILYLKLVGVFLYGFWIVLHRLDLSSEFYPLIRVKYIYLLALIPIILLDSYWLFSYLTNLEPDIITSCCGVIYADKNLQGSFIPITLSDNLLVVSFYLLAVLLLGMGWRLRKKVLEYHRPRVMLFSYSLLSFVFCLLSLIVITSFFSSYIYAMPSHNCPFDMLKSQYFYIGYPIYFTLFSASFLAISGCLVEIFRDRPGLASPVLSFQRFAIGASLLLLPVFVALVTYPTLVYLLAGGET